MKRIIYGIIGFALLGGLILYLGVADPLPNSPADLRRREVAALEKLAKQGECKNCLKKRLSEEDGNE